MKERLISIYKNTTYRTVATYVFVLFFPVAYRFYCCHYLPTQST